MNLDVWSVPIAIFYLWGAVAATAFGLVVAAGGSPVTPEIYGPLVYSLPAWSWVALQIATCIGTAVSAFSVWHKGVMFFSLCFTILMVAFAVMAIQAGSTGTIMVVNAGLWAAPIGLMTAYVAAKGGRFVR